MLIDGKDVRRFIFQLKNFKTVRSLNFIDELEARGCWWRRKQSWEKKFQVAGWRLPGIGFCALNILRNTQAAYELVNSINTF